MNKINFFITITMVCAMSFPGKVSAQTTTVTPCDADINQSGIVDLSDYSSLVSNFFATEPNPAGVDINKDGFVDISDYSHLVNYFFQICTITPSVTPGQSNEVLLQAEDYVAFTDTTVGNLGGVYRQDAVDIKSIVGGYAVGWMADTETLEYDFSIQQSGAYGVVLRTSTEVIDPKLRVEVVGQWSADVIIPKTASLADFQELTISGGHLPAGNHKLKITVVKQWVDLDWIKLKKDIVVQPTNAPSNTPVPTATTAPPLTSCRNTPGVILVQPGENIQTKVSSSPEGSTFCILAGEYRMQKISPKKNQKFIGEKGAILNGTKELKQFTRDGSLYVASGQTQQFEVHPSATKYGDLTGTGASGGEPDADGKMYACKKDASLPDGGFPRCTYPEQLFIDGKLLKHVWDKASVRPGTWWFDYAADKIYFADDPTNKKVETSGMDKAFEALSDNRSDGVQISNLVIEKYASRVQGYAVDMRSGNDVIIEYNELRHNHGGGVVVGNRGIVRNNYMHRMGQKAIGGGSDDMQILNNEFAYNNQEGFNFSFEGAATKWARTDRLIVKNNYVHDNIGNGIWTDIDNRNVIIDGNISVNNAQHGIHHEISFDAVIKNNFVANNGLENRSIGILLTSSKNTEVSNNKVVVSDGGVAGILLRANKDGKSDWGESYGGTNVKVFNNEVYTLETTDSYRPLSGFNATGSGPNSFDQVSSTSKFYSNSYFVKNPGLKHYRRNPDYTLTEAKKVGHETGSTESQITSSSQFPSMPAWNVQVGPR